MSLDAPGDGEYQYPSEMTDDEFEDAFQIYQENQQYSTADTVEDDMLDFDLDGDGELKSKYNEDRKELDGVYAELINMLEPRLEQGR